MAQSATNSKARKATDEPTEPAGGHRRRRHPRDEDPARPLVFDAVGAARQLGVSTRTVWYLVERGLLHPLKVGGRTVFPDHDLQRYVAELPIRTAKTKTA